MTSSKQATPCRPFVVIIGGAKVADKISVLTELVARASKVLLGGRMAYTFLASMNVAIGSTHVETASLGLARAVLRDAKVKVRRSGVQLASNALTCALTPSHVHLLVELESQLHATPSPHAFLSCASDPSCSARWTPYGCMYSRCHAVALRGRSCRAPSCFCPSTSSTLTTWTRRLHAARAL
jgi:Phosphoglycerate kinase